MHGFQCSVKSLQWLRPVADTEASCCTWEKISVTQGVLNIDFDCFSLWILMIFRSSPKWTPSIVLPCGGLWELILVSDQLWLWPLFRISEMVAYESFDCSWKFSWWLSKLLYCQYGCDCSEMSFLFNIFFQIPNLQQPYSSRNQQPPLKLKSRKKTRLLAVQVDQLHPV